MGSESVEQLIGRAKGIFRNLFGDEADIVTSAPGRLNFGGEHCDYMGGYVLPFPTVLVGVVVGKKREGSVTNMLVELIIYSVVVYIRRISRS